MMAVCMMGEEGVRSKRGGYSLGLCPREVKVSSGNQCLQVTPRIRAKCAITAACSASVVPTAAAWARRLSRLRARNRVTSKNSEILALRLTFAVKGIAAGGRAARGARRLKRASQAAGGAWAGSSWRMAITQALLQDFFSRTHAQRGKHDENHRKDQKQAK